MSSPCDLLRPWLALEAARPRPWSAEVEAHVAACPDCSAFSARAAAAALALRELPAVAAPAGLWARVSFAFDPRARGVRAATHLLGLPRRRAPAELDGRVVAALHEGSRQDRVVRELGLLRSPRAPWVLDRLVRDRVPGRPSPGSLGSAKQAPGALEERVARELIRLPRAEVRRAASRMGRRAAFEGLPGRFRRRPPGDRPQRALLLAVAAGAVAALLLAWSLAPVLAPPSGAAPHGVPPLGPVAVPGGPDQELPALARGLADGLTGGLWSMREVLGQAAVEDAGPRATLPERPAVRDGELRPDGRDGGGAWTPWTGAGEGPRSAPGAAEGPASPGTGRTFPGGFLSRLAASGAGLSYRGERRVELHLVPGGPALVYREEVLAAPGGGFAVEPLDILHPDPGSFDAELFLLLQKGREGFIFRHRDFRVRDEGLFLANYTVADLGEAVVAGRLCTELEVRRAEGAERWYRVLVDQETGLVLAYGEHRLDGSLLARVEHETFELDPDPAGVPTGGGPTVWVPLDPEDPAQLPFELSPPVAVPPGFELAEIATATLEGRPWVRLTYGDGLEQVFLLLGSPPAVPGLHPMGGPGPAQDAMAASRLWSFQVGAWAVVQGEVGARELAALGKVHPAELELLLQSAAEAP